MTQADPVRFSGTNLLVGNRTIQAPYPVRDAFMHDNRVIVLYELDSHRQSFGQFRNLVALTPDGEELWTADLPSSITGECYYEIASRHPLVVYSFHSFECEIDQTSGKIVRKAFLK